ncbi:hypothetical protein JR316_0008889 [Psilocybe cubensis]|uniref:Uncharacterized protein n=2 Tax=Psilocybe cubensis TaxID=181762 RepID=A0ACB8GS85_PSICU|nr:hypothetical protein JR316_0008889 [Psilocybe cubensis]KAH9478434.1 hypothetical protein JR316_0008889 [Psilocybe cubensis]
MDVDEPQPTRFSPFINFFDVSNNFPWQEPRPEHIRDRRAMMDGTLIFDILLDAGGIDASYMLYPPESQEGLQKLLDAIESSQYDILKKDCLVYFLLKWHQDGRERNFALQRCIPPQFSSLADAYWHLDTGINVGKAVALLSDSRLNRDYASKIIRAISLSPDSATLIRKYVQTAKPQLVEPLDLEQYAIALAESSVMEAWQFLRTFNENETDNMRARLFKKVLAWAVSPAPRPSALKELLTLPLAEFEESVLWAFAEKPPSDLLKFPEQAILQDLVCVRLIQAGRYSDAIKRDRIFASTTSAKNLRITQDRSKMVNEVYAALTPIERSLLDLELDPTVEKQPPLAPKPSSPPMRRQAAAQEPQDTSLSQSWEDVQMPDSLLNKSTSLREVRVPVTPNFGGPSKPSTPATRPPVIPINFSNGVSSSTAKNNNNPLASSHLGSSQLRNSLSGVGSRMAYGNTSAIASPASGIKLPTVPAPSSHNQTPVFVSASRQPNAFYQPPPEKTNGVQPTFEEDVTSSPERPDTSMNTEQDVEMEPEKEDQHEDGKRRGRKSIVSDNGDAEENTLQFSVFGAKETDKAEGSTAKKGMRKAPPGDFMSDEDDAMEEDQDVSTSKKRTSRTTTRSSKSSKPPAKKPRQTKEPRTIPGGIMEDGDLDEGDDEVAPLRAPSPKRTARKPRSSASVESTMDDGEGVQTRRRSSRLTTGGGSTHGGSPEPKVKKTSRASGGRKKR